MANLLNFYFEQLVTESDMDTLQSNLQQSDRLLMKDQIYIGVNQGYAVVEHNPVPDLTVDVGGPGIAYDQEGQRVNMPTTTTLDVSVDSGGSPTAVAVAGNEKWVSVFVQFDRTLSDSRFDGNGVPLFYRQDEAFQFVVEQGAEALIGAASRPALRADAILIADINLVNAQTQIFDADIESADTVTKPNSRFQFAFNLTASSPAQIRVGPLPDAMQAVLTELNNHIANVGNAHPASAITFDAANLPIPAGWSDVAAATEVQAALDGIVNDLEQTTAGTDGARRVGFNVNSTNWADASTLSSVTAGQAISEIVSDLARGAAAADDGAGRIGFDDANFQPRYGVETTIAGALDALATGAGRIGSAETVTQNWDFTAGLDVSGNILTASDSFTVFGNTALLDGAEFHHRPTDEGGTAWTFNGENAATDSRIKRFGAATQYTLTAGVSNVEIPLYDGGAGGLVNEIGGMVEGQVVIWDNGDYGSSREQTFRIVFQHPTGAGASVSFNDDVATPTALGGGPTDLTGVSIQAGAGDGTLNLRVSWGANLGALRNITVRWTRTILQSGQ